MSVSPDQLPSRNYYLDWLRVIAILGVFFHHSLRFFDPFDWHIKNSTTHLSLITVQNLIGLWGMPLIFIISGASTFYSLRKHGSGRFLKDRLLRLVVPLVISIFTLAPFMVYLERLSSHQFFGSFFKWLPQYFDGWYGNGGNFAWMGLHLWYLEALFLYSLLCLPLFAWLLKGPGLRLLSWICDRLAFPGVIYLLGIPVSLLLIVIDADSHFILSRNFGGWSLPIYIVFFINGFLLAASRSVQDSVRRLRWISLAGGILLVVIMLKLLPHQQTPAFGTLRYTQIFSMYGMASWFLVLATLGFGMKYLSRPTPFLAYANEAVLPFYIIHQPVLLAIGFFVVEWSLPDPAKWLVIALAAFSAVMLIYEFAIRRQNPLRLLFGMKPRGVAPAKPVEQPAPIPG